MCSNIKNMYGIDQAITCPSCNHSNKKVLEHVDKFDLEFKTDKFKRHVIRVKINCDNCGEYYYVLIKLSGIIIDVAASK